MARTTWVGPTLLLSLLTLGRGLYHFTNWVEQHRCSRSNRFRRGGDGDVTLSHYNHAINIQARFGGCGQYFLQVSFSLCYFWLKYKTFPWFLKEIIMSLKLVGINKVLNLNILNVHH